ncbi:MAG: glucose-6-phosphate isomerase [Alphaproteobacteria bacterium]|nr:glucose-6-phosphate isomerase [Alphaproteobacteria bacterium]
MSVTPAWQALARHREVVRAKTPEDIFLADPARLDAWDIRVGGLRYSYAFQNADAETLDLLVDLAREKQVEAWRAKMFAGEKINATEKRAVLHTALRRPGDALIAVDGMDIVPQIRATQDRIAAFVDGVRSGRINGATGKSFKHVVNIGIGGSDLGPRLAARALLGNSSKLEAHFVANADAFELLRVLRNLDAEETLFVVVSKTFTTQETLLNMRTARQWLAEKLGEDAVARHFAAVSVNQAEVSKFGIPAAHMFPMWDWVGGRFSLWSAVGLSVALVIGNEGFSALLAGAAEMDAHFQTAPLAQNMPVMLALLGIWNRNFLGQPALAILPYSERLRDLPRYLQQLEMESNGKSVTREGAPAFCETAPALFGECGTVGQHSFHQWLHQGTSPIPADFIGVVADDLNRPDHHRALLTNMVAQIGALAFGQKAAVAHDVYPGGRSSNLLLLDRLDPYCLGLLLALYEHKVFVQGIIWNINSFDQPGVELGKRLARSLDSAAIEGPAAGMMGRLFANLTQNDK